MLVAPGVRQIGFHLYESFLYSYCITSGGLWTTWSQVKIHTVYTYLSHSVACAVGGGLNLPLDCCRTSQQ